MTAPDAVATALALVLAAGAVFFTGVSVVGLVRLPDCYSRAHATSKADTLGTICALGSAAVVFGASQATLKLGALILFVLLTSPTAAHAVIRSAYDQGVVPWTGPDRGDEHSGNRPEADPQTGDEPNADETSTRGDTA